MKYGYSQTPDVRLFAVYSTLQEHFRRCERISRKSNDRRCAACGVFNDVGMVELLREKITTLFVVNWKKYHGTVLWQNLAKEQNNR